MTNDDEFYSDECVDQAETVAGKVRALNQTAFHLGEKAAAAYQQIEAKQEEIRETHRTLGRIQHTITALLTEESSPEPVVGDER